MRLETFDRDEFVGHRFEWNPGEHLFASEPTQQGKSYLIGQLTQKVLAQYEGTGLRFASLMPKPTDPATAELVHRAGLEVTDRWPPKRHLFGPAPAGHVVWPRHLKDAEPGVNRRHVGGILRTAMRDQYWRGNSLTLMDDAHIAAVLYGLNTEAEEHLTAGGGMGSALWIASQKPSGSKVGSLTTFAYSAPTHLIFGKDPDERNLARLAEIGGVNPDEIAGIVRNLPMHRIITPQGPKNVSEKLYIHKLGYMCQIGL